MLSGLTVSVPLFVMLPGLKFASLSVTVFPEAVVSVPTLAAPVPVVEIVVFCFWEDRSRVP